MKLHAEIKMIIMIMNIIIILIIIIIIEKYSAHFDGGTLSTWEPITCHFISISEICLLNCAVGSHLSVVSLRAMLRRSMTRPPQYAISARLSSRLIMINFEVAARFYKFKS